MSEDDKEDIYLNTIFTCSLMVDNLVWLLKTTELQDSEECGIIMEQTLAMKELVDSVLALAEITEETTIH